MKNVMNVRKWSERNTFLFLPWLLRFFNSFLTKILSGLYLVTFLPFDYFFVISAWPSQCVVFNWSDF